METHLDDAIDIFNHYRRIAGSVVRIFVEEGFWRNPFPADDVIVDNMSVDGGNVEIEFHVYWCGETDYKDLTVPYDFVNYFDHDKVREYIRTIVADRNAATEAKRKAKEDKEKEEKIALLKKLQAEFPDVK